MSPDPGPTATWSCPTWTTRSPLRSGPAPRAASCSCRPARQCGQRRMPPRPMCPPCAARSGTPGSRPAAAATIWSFAVPHPAAAPGLRRARAVQRRVVALEEDPTIRFVGNLVATDGRPINEVDPATIEIGDARPRHLRQPSTTSPSRAGSGPRTCGGTRHQPLAEPDPAKPAPPAALRAPESGTRRRRSRGQPFGPPQPRSRQAAEGIRPGRRSAAGGPPRTRVRHPPPEISGPTLRPTATAVTPSGRRDSAREKKQRRRRCDGRRGESTGVTASMRRGPEGPTVGAPGQAALGSRTSVRSVRSAAERALPAELALDPVLGLAGVGASRLAGLSSVVVASLTGTSPRLEVITLRVNTLKVITVNLCAQGHKPPRGGANGDGDPHRRARPPVGRHGRHDPLLPARGPPPPGRPGRPGQALRPGPPRAAGPDPRPPGPPLLPRGDPGPAGVRAARARGRDLRRRGHALLLARRPHGAHRRVGRARVTHARRRAPARPVRVRPRHVRRHRPRRAACGRGARAARPAR